jgi:hypothetical protein
MLRILIAVPLSALAMTMIALAQKPSEPPAKTPVDEKPAATTDKGVEELLIKAFQNSPEIQLAEAKLKEAEASMRQARLNVTQKVIELQQALSARQSLVANEERALKRAQQLRESGQIPQIELEAITAELAKHKADLAQIESQVNMLTGKLPVASIQSNTTLFPQTFRFDLAGGGSGTGIGGGLGSGAGIGEPPAKRLPHGQMANKLSTLLGSPYRVPDASRGIPLTELISHVRDTTHAPILTKDVTDELVRIDFKGELSLGAFFQVLCDAAPDVSIFVRDYGFLITKAAPPDDAMPFMDFWRTGEKGGK